MDFEYVMNSFWRSDATVQCFLLSHIFPSSPPRKKAQSKIRPYHDPDYEPRIQAALAGVNEKKYMSLAAAAREDVSVLCTFLSFIC